MSRYGVFGIESAKPATNPDKDTMTIEVRIFEVSAIVL